MYPHGRYLAVYIFNYCQLTADAYYIFLCQKQKMAIRMSAPKKKQTLRNLHSLLSLYNSLSNKRLDTTFKQRKWMVYEKSIITFAFLLKKYGRFDGYFGCYEEWGTLNPFYRSKNVEHINLYLQISSGFDGGILRHTKHDNCKDNYKAIRIVLILSREAKSPHHNYKKEWLCRTRTNFRQNCTAGLE